MFHYIQFKMFLKDVLALPGLEPGCWCMLSVVVGSLQIRDCIENTSAPIDGGTLTEALHHWWVAGH